MARVSLRERWAKLRYRRLLARMAGPRLLRAFADAHPDAFFIEIGANDGSAHDQLRPIIRTRPWRGIMVEPVPYVFARLQANYGDLDRVALANVAISDRDGRMPFWHLEEAGPDDSAQLPDWYDELGSFSRETILGHGDQIPDIERRLRCTEVPTMTFDTLCETHGVADVDLVLVDTEGHDWEILRRIDLARYAPRLLVYEHYHLGAADRAAALEHLAAHGYETLEEHFDTFALDTRPSDALTRTWRGLRPAIPATSAHEERAQAA